MIMFERIPSKLLLAGEYSVLYGGKALAEPHVSRSGHLTLDKDQNTDLNRLLREYLVYLKVESPSWQSLVEFDFDSLETHINNGLNLATNIPLGYGLGSSGVFCVALIKAFGRIKISELESDYLAKLKFLLGRMEDFFHKPSSGLDPLVSFVNQPILLKDKSDKSIETVEKVEHKFGLVDTQVARSTAHFVGIFKNKMENQEFKMAFENLLVINNELIANILGQHQDKVKASMYELSTWQLSYMQEMIPTDFLSNWKTQLAEGKDFYKINGAGGGGYLMQWLD